VAVFAPFDEPPRSLTPSNTINHFTPRIWRTSRMKRAWAVGPRPPLSTALPPMPWFRTATLPMVAAFACRRRDRSSGQRLFMSVVEPRPSVIESPSVTSADIGGSAMTSRPTM
jgi:hypothetical protein